MTREEAIYCMKSCMMSDDSYEHCIKCKYYKEDSCESSKAHAMAIEALEQEPCDDCISRKEVLDKIYNVDGMEALENSNIFAKHYANMVKSLPPVTPKQQTCEDAVSRQVVIDEIEYELEWINSALDTNTLDFNARERLRQRKGEAREILNTVQQLPRVTSQPKKGRWIDIMVGDMPSQACDQCNTFYPLAYTGGGHKYCPNCGAKMQEVEL